MNSTLDIIPFKMDVLRNNHTGVKAFPIGHSCWQLRQTVEPHYLEF